MKIGKAQIEKTVYFVRHGQSVANATPVFQGPSSPLSDRGKLQALSVADRVSKLAFDVLIASPYSRAKETAEAIEKTTGKKAEFSDLFVERIKPTSINDKPHEDEEAKSIWTRWSEGLHTPGTRVEDGENFEDIIERADKALKFLADRPEKTLVVVTHGYFIRTIVARAVLEDSLSGETFKKFQQRMTMKNTGITALQYATMPDGSLMWRLWIFNDHAHLAE